VFDYLTMMTEGIVYLALGRVKKGKADSQSAAG